jgi:hypothetical protein
MGSLLQRSLPPSTLVVAIDPGKAPHRVWLSTDAAGLVTEPLTVPVLRAGLETLDGLVRRYSAGGQLVFAVEAAGSLHRAWVSDLSRRFPAPVRVFAPSETAAARTQLGMRRFKTDDRDCAALTYLTRRLEHASDFLAQGFGVAAFAVHEHDEVIRVADEPPVRLALAAAHGAPAGGADAAAALPRAVQVLIEPGHGDVEDQR